MTAVTVHHEAAAERTLSEAPPEQWDALLQALGASVRPVEKHIDREAPYTVTSLLGMMEPLAADDTILSKPMAPLSEVPRGGAAGRSRARRRPLPAPTLPVQQDTRDLEELLRELA